MIGRDVVAGRDCGVVIDCRASIAPVAGRDAWEEIDVVRDATTLPSVRVGLGDSLTVGTLTESADNARD